MKATFFIQYAAIMDDVYRLSDVEIPFYNLISIVASRTLSISLTIKLTNLVE